MDIQELHVVECVLGPGLVLQILLAPVSSRLTLLMAPSHLWSPDSLARPSGASLTPWHHHFMTPASQAFHLPA